MKKQKLIIAIAVAFLLVFSTTTYAASKKIRLTKAVISEISGFSITATKNSKTYTINAEKAVLQNAKGKKATIDQFFAGDQINVKGSYDNSGNIVARTIKDQSLKETSLTRRNVGSENLKDEVISSLDFISNGVITEDKLKSGTLTNASISDSANLDSSKLNLSNISSLTSGTANITTLNLGTNAIANGNLTGNWNFNSGNLSGIGTIESGNITTSGTVTANGTGNNYFAGNVGIGTTAPAGKLTITGPGNDGAFEAIRINDPNPSGIGPNYSWAFIFIPRGEDVTGTRGLIISEQAQAAVTPYTNASVIRAAGGVSENVSLEPGLNASSARGEVQFTNADAATPSLNQSSVKLRLYGRYYDGSASKPDSFFIQSIIGSGTNPTSAMTFSHTGASGGVYYSFMDGNVGIGTTNPQSKLHLDGGYLQLDNNSGAPASADCDAAAEEGRLYWDATADEFYICSGASGWRKVTTVAP